MSANEDQEQVAVSVERKRVYLIKQTLIETYFYDPDEIRRDFADPLDAWNGSFEDFIVDLFDEHNGSQFHGLFFYNDANPQVWCDLEERWDDE